MKKLNTIGSMATLGAFLIAMNFGGITGCGSTEDAADGGGGTTTGTGTGDPTADAVTTTNDTLTVAGEAMSSALSGGAGLTALTIDRVKNVSETVDESVACSGGGTASVSGTIDTTQTTGTIDVEMAFDDCDGINGDLSLDATLTLSDTEFDFEMSFDGELGGNGCEVAFDELTMILNIVIEGEDVSSSGSVDGTVSATCGDDSVTCTFDSVSIDAGEEAFEESCTCTGDGCADDSSSSDTNEDDSSDDDSDEDSSCVDECMASDICDADVAPDRTDCDACIEDCNS